MPERKHVIVYFNSTMVQLIEVKKAVEWLSWRQFQFYYGSINSNRGDILVQNVELYFNSTMVQLIAASGSSITSLTYNFNSTMVQLIDLRISVLQQRYDLFQFYYGSINRPRNVKRGDLGEVFQFYYGSINSRHKITTKVFIIKYLRLPQSLFLSVNCSQPLMLRFPPEFDGKR